MKTKKLLSWSGGVLGVILIGAVGSGVWSGILSPALSWLTDLIIRFLSNLSVTYKDYIYNEAAKGFHENISLSLLSIFIGMVVGLVLSLLFTCYIIRYSHFKEKLIDTLNLKKNFILANIISFSVIVMIFFIIMPLMHTNTITTKSLNSLEIISPFVEQKEYLSLRSDFFSIKNSRDYEDFYNKMVELSDKNKIKLPLFKPL